MRKLFFPAFAIATLFLATSCGQDGSGSSTELENANGDETVNPAHIRGYGDREPGRGGAREPQPNQYYSFSTTGLEAGARRELEGNVAIEMVKVYYDVDDQLSTLNRRYNRPGGATAPPTPDAAEAVNASKQADGAAPQNGAAGAESGTATQE
ncbi:hypothetical protein [Pontibacter rugosus]|uniref:Uncharacterized protein n=1 Tax=Pontibacter rugosus TaxID=1745966 RepID=A0ABW3SMC6_9BACT